MNMHINPAKMGSAYIKNASVCGIFQERDVIWRSDSPKIALNGKNYVLERS